MTDLPGDRSDGCDSLRELSYEWPAATADMETRSVGELSTRAMKLSCVISASGSWGRQ